MNYKDGAWIKFSRLVVEGAKVAILQRNPALEIDVDGMYQIREANQLVKEFMLAANVSVADKILKHFPLCSLLRRYISVVEISVPRNTSTMDLLLLATPISHLLKCGFMRFLYKKHSHWRKYDRSRS